jgi:hypothetical protein
MMLMVFQQLNGQNFVRQMRAIVFVEDLRWCSCIRSFAGL